MKTGKLTPKSGDVVDAMRFTGAFDQPDGFGSVLDVTVRRSGDAYLTLTYRMHGAEHVWSIGLTEPQRNALAQMLSQNQSRTWERYDPKEGE